MARMVALVYALIICVAVAPSYGEYYSKGSHVPRKEKVARLHFFLHHQHHLASSVFAVDDPLRVGSEPNSKIVGKAQGLYLSSSKMLVKLVYVVEYIDFAFTAGRFNGSSFAVFSRNPVWEGDREVAVVGGRGKFRMAKGFAKINASFLNATTYW